MQRLTWDRDAKAKQLRACTLFATLAPADLKDLAGVCGARDHADGEFLFQADEEAQGFHIIVDGVVKVCRFGADGKEQVLHVLGPGDACGEVPMFQGAGYPAHAHCLGKVRTLYLPREPFIALAREKVTILLSMLGVLSMRLRHLVQLVDDLSLKEVSARLAKHLLDLSARAGGARTVELETSKSMLASRLGTIAETLSRTLTKMKRRKIVGVARTKVTILDPAALQALAAGVKL
jgi:CRP/FNR family transcriptional regulator, dissimilatory nitrate respiration regulator